MTLHFQLNPSLIPGLVMAYPEKFNASQNGWIAYNYQQDFEEWRESLSHASNLTAEVAQQFINKSQAACQVG